MGNMFHGNVATERETFCRETKVISLTRHLNIHQRGVLEQVNLIESFIQLWLLFVQFYLGIFRLNLKKSWILLILENATLENWKKKNDSIDQKPNVLYNNICTKVTLYSCSSKIAISEFDVIDPLNSIALAATSSQIMWQTFTNRAFFSLYLSSVRYITLELKSDLHS